MALVAPWDRTDPRVEHIMGRAVAAGEAPHAVLLGFPTDEGVLRNGGRPGAARGPAEVRRWLARLAPDARDSVRFSAHTATTSATSSMLPSSHALSSSVLKILPVSVTRTFL